MSKSKSDNKSNTRLNDIDNAEERKRLYHEARKGSKEYRCISAMANNLKPLNERSEEEAREIRRKGAEATNRLKGEKKNAKQILDSLLPIYANTNAITDNDNIPKDLKKEILNKNIHITQYDLIMLAMIYKAQNGDVKSAQYISDLYGDIVTKEVHNVNETISESDKKLIEKLSNRLNIIDID